MHFDTGAAPGIADDEILVAVAFAGVNGPDLMQRRGLYPPPKNASPILGLEVAVGSKVEIDLIPIMLKRITYTGSTLRSRPDAYKAEIARQLETLV
jgi:hypothetical protein